MERNEASTRAFMERGAAKMTLIFERFTENYIEDAVKLALCEFEKERESCPDIPMEDHSDKIKGMLYWLSTQPYGKVALYEGKLVGYMLFAGPWNGFFGNVKGVFCPLGGSALAHGYPDRGRLASMLFAEIAGEFVKDGVYSLAISRYAHDEEISKSLMLNGFGIRCSDAVCDITGTIPTAAVDSIHFEELPYGEFLQVYDLQMGLVEHLASSPIFYPTDMEQHKHWFEKEDMRVFVAKYGDRVIGFISVDVNGETFISETQCMANICGAFFEKEYRGNGIAQALLSHICKVLRAEGITHLGVDCETLNPTALNFWGKYFTPYTYSFARRIDERI